MISTFLIVLAGRLAFVARAVVILTVVVAAGVAAMVVVGPIEWARDRIRRYKS